MCVRFSSPAEKQIESIMRSACVPSVLTLSLSAGLVQLRIIASFCVPGFGLAGLDAVVIGQFQALYVFKTCAYFGGKLADQ